jgi:hypothetical protein
MADHVSALSFNYLDSTGTATAVNTNVRYINMSFTVSQNNVSLITTTTVFPANF